MIPIICSIWTTVGGTVRMDMFFGRDDSGDIWLRPLVKLKVDRQNLNALVDTNSPFTFFIWKKWYEDVLQKDCGSTVYGCYECDPPPCESGPTTTFEFLDRMRVTTFLHTVSVSSGVKTATGINVGLISNVTQGDRVGNAWASLGLEGSVEDAPEYESIMEQLLAQPRPQRLIESNSFSIYTKPGKYPTGEVILGGQDPTKYDGLLGYVRIVDDEEQFVQLLGVWIGKKQKGLMRLKAWATLDSGTTHLCVPLSQKRTFLKLLRDSGKKRVAIEEESGHYRLSCAKAKYLPSITFHLRGLQGEEVPLELPGLNIVTKDDWNRCYVDIFFHEVEQWILGSNAFIGYYYFYEAPESRIGFARARA
ncbi:hypothetical protein FOL47_004664 [Perkinsus chesapeaki]|uniref:Peptidase A1 domain-containing protein n=1 Tax=Perkinsus chesapeaki TaxID=330153 RepID=A0A7J6M2I9_PERCH|nr:hypothetical protein FOL47_004664 [Perkinsus chesapeaki]